MLAVNERNNKRVKRLKEFLSLVLLSCLAFFFLVPLLWLFYVSFVPKIDIFRVPPAILVDFSGTVKRFTLSSFAQAFGRWQIGLALFNSLFITVASIIFTILVCSLCAYGFAFMDFRGKNVLFVTILATIMLPTVTMIAPYYQVLGIYGLRNTRLGLILPYAASAFSVFLLRQYFVRIPLELFEAAVVDGASRFRIWWQIVMPLAKPAITALAIYQFRNVWNDFLTPMIVLRNEKLFTIPIKLQFMDSVNINIPWDAMMATGFIAVSIPFVFFLVYQRQFMEGISGALKG
ncbi:MAG: carbohydrate ABC transporter permease [Bacillota bacterium]